MITEELLPLLAMVRAARSELGRAEPDSAARCAQLLRQAEDCATDLPSWLADDAGVLRSVTAVRTELGTCLIAADRMQDAGVSGAVIVDVLRRGTTLAERVLAEAVSAPS